MTKETSLADRPGSRPRRFIAGAICPSCGAEDRIYIQNTGAGDSRHCSACNFSDRRPETGTGDDSLDVSPVRLPE